MTEIIAKDRAELLAGLRDGRWKVRRESALGLMHAPEPSDLPRLAALLHDPKVEVRHAVVVAVAVAHGADRESEVVPLLVERALTDASVRVPPPTTATGASASLAARKAPRTAAASPGMATSAGPPTRSAVMVASNTSRASRFGTRCRRSKSGSSVRANTGSLLGAVLVLALTQIDEQLFA